ncbi:MAG: ATP-binding protein [Pseudomonadota bacterium]|jgi:signal transduction histidine kinase|uniref:sensor histidine kinase n=1 Tax=Burkholderiaceae TaxID=119060 RepID=UPI0010F8D456|nr:ATP-binding protein [Burkholderia sp. 4M9327F10]
MDTSIVVPITAHVPASIARDGFDAPNPADPASAAASASIHRHTPSSREDSAAEREIARLRARVRELSAELVHAQEAACHRVASELHDSVGAELTATRFALAGVETWLPADAPPQCAAALQVATRSLDTVCEATRHAVAELHTPALEAGIVGALSQWTGEFAARTQLRTSFVCAADVRLTRLPTDAALAIFRVAQEALNNIAKHARASAADVRIEASRRHLTLVVSDNGVGLAPGARKRRGHFGLAGMRARCAAFDGTVKISTGRRDEARQVSGTTVRARFAWDAMLDGAMCVERRAASAVPLSS